MLPCESSSETKYQLRRTSSASFWHDVGAEGLQFRIVGTNMSGGSWAAALGFLNKATDCCHRCASSPLPPLEFGFMQIYDQLISKLYILQQKCHVDKCTMLIKSGKNGVHISCILVQHDLISLISLPFGTFNIMIDQVVILRKARGLCRRLPGAYISVQWGFYYY